MASARIYTAYDILVSYRCFVKYNKTSMYPGIYVATVISTAHVCIQILVYVSTSAYILCVVVPSVVGIRIYISVNVNDGCQCQVRVGEEDHLGPPIISKSMNHIRTSVVLHACVHIHIYIYIYIHIYICLTCALSMMAMLYMIYA